MASRQAVTVLDAREHFEILDATRGSATRRPGLQCGPVEDFAGTDQGPPQSPAGIAMAAHMKLEGFLKSTRLDPVREQGFGGVQQWEPASARAAGQW